MKIDVLYDGESYPFDFATMDLPEYFTVKAIANLDGGAFQQAVMGFNPAAVHALTVLARRRAGVPTIAKDVDVRKITHVELDALAESMTAAIARAGVDAAEAALRDSTPADEGADAASADEPEREGETAKLGRRRKGAART